jgi:hypothetical protein
MQNTNPGALKSIDEDLVIPPGTEDHPAIKQCFTAYCRFNGGLNRPSPLQNQEGSEPRMSALQFFKLAQDLEMLEPVGPTPVSMVDAIFSRAKEHEHKNLRYPQYLKVLTILQNETGIDVFALIFTLAAQGEIKPSPATHLGQAARSTGLHSATFGRNSSIANRKLPSMSGEPNSTLPLQPTHDTPPAWYYQVS